MADSPLILSEKQNTRFVVKEERRFGANFNAFSRPKRSRKKIRSMGAWERESVGV